MIGRVLVVVVAAAAATLMAAPAFAQDHAQMDHAQMDHGTMDHDMPMDQAMPGMQPMTAGNAPPPPHDHYADRSFPADDMARARMEMMRESGGQTTAFLLVNLAEAQIGDGRNGYRWDGEAWLGGDIDRLTVKSEGEGGFGGKTDSAEVQLLYSHAVGPYFDLQAGLRQDIRPTPARTYATIGVEGLAPYAFNVGAAAFLSTTGDLLGRIEGSYDQRLTQRFILQPRVELNFAAQDVREQRIGAGLTDAEIGLRLRYGIKRELAPYVGLSWERAIGRTATLARRDGEDTGGLKFVTGIRAWF